MSTGKLAMNLFTARNVVMVGFALPIMVLGFLSAKFGRCPEYSDWTGVDAYRRLPLWFPYAIDERAGYTFFSCEEPIYDANFRQRNSVCSLCSIRPEHGCILNDIYQFKVAGNCVYGAYKKPIMTEEGALGRHSKTGYFLFATNMVSAQTFDGESAYLAKCRDCGVDGRDIAYFLDNFEHGWKKIWQVPIANRFFYAITNHWTLGEFFAGCILLFGWGLAYVKFPKN